MKHRAHTNARVQRIDTDKIIGIGFGLVRYFERTIIGVLRR